MVLTCQTQDCAAPVAYVVTWRTRVMPASAFWYQCERCMEESVACLERDPQMVNLRVRPSGRVRQEVA